MTRPKTPLGRVTAVAVALVTALAVAACGTGEGPVQAPADATADATAGSPDDADDGATTSSPGATGRTTVADDPSSTAPSSTAGTTSPPTTTNTTGGLLALDVLAFVTVTNEHGDGYERDLFGYPADLDRDGCDTRSEVLQLESQGLTQIDAITCRVIEGDWYSLYDDQMLVYAADVDIDHVVALKEAWDSGAWQWSGAARLAFANDLTDDRTLLAVSSDSNVSKSDKDPSNWLPSNADAVCRYIGDWVAIKARWNLSMDESEYGRVRNLLNGSCRGLRIAPFAAAPVDVSAAPIDTPTPPDTDVYYANCTEARAAGAAPLLVGEPGYRSALDRDKDGVACE